MSFFYVPTYVVSGGNRPNNNPSNEDSFAAAAARRAQMLDNDALRRENERLRAQLIHQAPAGPTVVLQAIPVVMVPNRTPFQFGYPIGWTI